MKLEMVDQKMEMTKSISVAIGRSVRLLYSNGQGMAHERGALAFKGVDMYMWA